MSSPRPKVAEVLPVLGRVLARCRPYLRRQRRLIALSCLALFAQAALRVVEPWPLKFVFDVLTGFVPQATMTAWGGGVAIIIGCAVAIPLLRGLTAAAGYGQTVGFAIAGNRVLTSLRGDLYRHLQQLSPRFHGRARAGDLVVRVVGDIGMLKEAAVTSFLPLVANLVVLVAMLGIMLWLHWGLTLAALSVAPVFWLLSSRLNRGIHSAARKQRKREGALATTAAESMAAISVLQSLSLEKTFAREFTQHNERGLKEGVRGKRLAARLERGVDFLVAVSTGLVIGYGALLVLQKTLTPGDLLLFATYLRRSFKPIQDFAKYSARLSKAAAAGERVLAVMDQQPDVSDEPDARPAPALRGAIRFDGVRYAYDPGSPVLKDVSLEAKPGELVALVGPAGAGKSTLVSLLLRLHDPTRGRVSIDGEDIRSFTLASLRSQIGVVQQDSMLLSGTVWENIALGREGATDEQIEEAVRRVGCEAFIRSLPEGYETQVGERGVTLSTGQRQLIALCRMAVRDVPILILDEPTASLDWENKRRVHTAIRRLAHGRTTLLVTHDLTRAATADRIFRLEKGEIAAEGTHVELLCTDPWYASHAGSLDEPVNGQRYAHALAG